MVDEIKEKFTGSWKMDRSEHFEEFMSAMGLNFLIRKMAGFSKPDNNIKVEEDGTIVIATNSAFMKNEQRFKLNEEFLNMPTYENGKLRISATPAEPIDVPYPEYAEREITADGEMLLTIKVKDVECKRWFKKQA